MKNSCILQGKIRCCHLINNSFWAHVGIEAFILLVARGQKGRSYGGPSGVWHQLRWAENEQVIVSLSLIECAAALHRLVHCSILSTYCASPASPCVLPCSYQPHHTFGFLSLWVSIILNCVLLLNWSVLLFCQQIKWWCLPQSPVNLGRVK